MAEDLHPGTDEDLARVAGEIEAALRLLLQRLRRNHKEEIAASGLTVPQLSVLSELVEADGLSLNEVSERMRLAHSTVSGIVDRLERRGMVERRADVADRRFSRIYLSAHVRSYVHEVLPARRLGLVIEALRKVRPEERAVVLEGLTVLCRALGDSGP